MEIVATVDFDLDHYINQRAHQAVRANLSDATRASL